VEAYALDRDDLDLYGAHAAIDFTARLRGTQRFDSIADLVTQMHQDVAQARELTAPPIGLPADAPGRGLALLSGLMGSRSGWRLRWIPQEALSPTLRRRSGWTARSRGADAAHRWR
jgi:hypothetical protein